MMCTGQSLSVQARMNTADQWTGMNAKLRGDNREKCGWVASNMRHKRLCSLVE
jgi:hypothetical protein